MNMVASQIGLAFYMIHVNISQFSCLTIGQIGTLRLTLGKGVENHGKHSTLLNNTFGWCPGMTLF